MSDDIWGATDPDDQLAVDFLQAWFAPRPDVPDLWAITIGNTRNGINSAIRRNQPASVTRTLGQWSEDLDGHLDGFLAAMGGNAFVYPLWTKASTMLLTENNYVGQTVGTPGFWFDLPMVSESKLNMFLDYLNGDRVDLRPSMVTGDKTMSVSSSDLSFRTVRMWWPLPDKDEAPVRGPRLSVLRLAHARFMKRKFMEFNTSNMGELLMARPTMHELSYRLPGTGGCALVFWKSNSPPMRNDMWLYLGMLADEHLVEYQEVVEDLGVGEEDTDRQNALAQINALPWDSILVPAGWSSTGMGSDPWVSYWMVPGIDDLVAAHTEKEHLVLHTAHWATGLVGAWDLGIRLTKWVVAAILAADGNGAALADRYLTTGKVY